MLIGFVIIHFENIVKLHLFLLFIYLFIYLFLNLFIYFVTDMMMPLKLN